MSRNPIDEVNEVLGVISPLTMSPLEIGVAEARAIKLAIRAAEIRGATWALQAKLNVLPLYTPIELAVDAERIVDERRKGERT